jgi:hypothetical protein
VTAAGLLSGIWRQPRQYAEDLDHCAIAEFEKAILRELLQMKKSGKKMEWSRAPDLENEVYLMNQPHRDIRTRYIISLSK